MVSSNRTNSITSVERALDILEALGRSERGLQLSELSRIVGLPHPTVYRILGTLRSRNYVAQDEGTRLYRLSTRILQLQDNVVSNLSLVEKAIPILNRLAKSLQASAHLAILGDTEAFYLESRRSNWILNRATPSNRVVPIYCTAIGKVLMAALSPEKLESRLERIELLPRTPHTITNRQELLTNIEEVRQRGYGLDLQEHLPDVTCIAAPVRDRTGSVIAAMSIATLTQDLTQEWQATLPAIVMAGADEISHSMGWQGISPAMNGAQ